MELVLVQMPPCKGEVPPGLCTTTPLATQAVATSSGAAPAAPRRGPWSQTRIRLKAPPPPHQHKPWSKPGSTLQSCVQGSHVRSCSFGSSHGWIPTWPETPVFRKEKQLCCPIETSGGDTGRVEKSLPSFQVDRIKNKKKSTPRALYAAYF